MFLSSLQAKNISSMVKQKRKEKAGKWEVPLPAVKAQSEADVFKILKSGQSRKIRQPTPHSPVK